MFFRFVPDFLRRETNQKRGCACEKRVNSDLFIDYVINEHSRKNEKRREAAQNINGF